MFFLFVICDPFDDVSDATKNSYAVQDKLLLTSQYGISEEWMFVLKYTYLLGHSNTYLTPWICVFTHVAKKNKGFFFCFLQIYFPVLGTGGGKRKHT